MASSIPSILYPVAAVCSYTVEAVVSGTESSAAGLSRIFNRFAGVSPKAFNTTSFDGMMIPSSLIARGLQVAIVIGGSLYVMNIIRSCVASSCEGPRRHRRHSRYTMPRNERGYFSQEESSSGEGNGPVVKKIDQLKGEANQILDELVRKFNTLPKRVRDLLRQQIELNNQARSTYTETVKTVVRERDIEERLPTLIQEFMEAGKTDTLDKYLETHPELQTGIYDTKLAIEAPIRRATNNFQSLLEHVQDDAEQFLSIVYILTLFGKAGTKLNEIRSISSSYSDEKDLSIIELLGKERPEWCKVFFNEFLLAFS